MTKVRKLKRVEAEKKVKIAELMKQEFQIALSTLMNSTGIPAKTAWQMLQVFDAVVEHQKKYEELRMKLLLAYGRKDAEGNISMNEAKTEYLLMDKPKFDKEYKELLELEVEIPTIPLSSISEVRITPAMLSVLTRTVLNPLL